MAKESVMSRSRINRELFVITASGIGIGIVVTGVMTFLIYYSLINGYKSMGFFFDFNVMHEFLFEIVVFPIIFIVSIIGLYKIFRFIKFVDDYNAYYDFFKNFCEGWYVNDEGNYEFKKE
jgi:hypothetical protein